MGSTLTRWQRRLFERSRDPAWLWGALIVILGLGIVGGFIAERLSPAGREVPVSSMLDPSFPWNADEEAIREAVADAAIDAVARELASEPVDIPAVLDRVVHAARILPSARIADVRSRIEGAALDESARQVVLLTLSAGADAEGGPPLALRRLAEADPLEPYANLALGLLHEMNGRTEDAFAAFEREAAGPGRGAEAARERIVMLAMAVEDDERLGRLAADPRFADVIDSAVRLELAVAARDWWRALLLIVPAQYQHAELAIIGLAAVAGLMWFIFFAQLAQPPSPWSARVGLCLAAVILGAVSTVATVFVILIEEEVFGFVVRYDLVGGLVYFIAGVGLREELCKLLLFLPLAPILIRRGSELEMFIVAGCVGLGFAAEENVSYFHGMGGSVSAPGRFLTANFLHVAMTGLIGLAFCRMFIDRRQGAALFAQTFVGVVVLHGLYDAFIMLPDLAEAGFATFFCIAALAFWFFRELRGLRSVQRDTVSPVATFVVGLSLLLAVTIIILSADVGLRSSVSILAPATLELALVAYLFLREMPGSMVRV